MAIGSFLITVFYLSTQMLMWFECPLLRLHVSGHRVLFDYCVLLVNPDAHVV